MINFKRVSLKNGETKNVKIKISEKAFLAVDEEGNSIFDSKEFTLYVGVSQPDEVSIELGGVRPIEADVKF